MNELPFKRTIIYHCIAYAKEVQLVQNMKAVNFNTCRFSTLTRK